MIHTLNVYSLPSLVTPDELVGGTVVIVDVLRASTTIIHALEAGAKEVQACLEVDDVERLAAKMSDEEDVVRGGERKGLPIEGFDLGNSPSEYEPHIVGNKTVLLTTTNGTKAMVHCRKAKRMLVGAFVNAAAICRELIGQEQIHIVCAGTDGKVSNDDVLLAGLLVNRLERHGDMVFKLNAQAIAAREQWLSSFALPVALGGEPLDPEQLAKPLCRSLGGQNLIALGLMADIIDAARLDRFDSVPEVDPNTLQIRLP